ncbi:hypothetical protein HAX54_051183 [Datura stramonium]|uniref:Uncharacterized protein n=1 Tax=Datura stramonium TaxID=4076 RepID=A0ABS8SZ18_DATST|nr:hypothetical protein [Datura stramonium]
MGEIIVEQLHRKALQQTTFVPFLVLISLLCLKIECTYYRPLDKMWRAEGFFDSATKRDKDSPTFIKINLNSCLSNSLNLDVSDDASVSPFATRPVSSPLVVEKLGSLCAPVDVLKGEGAAFREETDGRKAMVFPMGIDLNIPAMVLDSPIVEKSHPDN